MVSDAQTSRAQSSRSVGGEKKAPSKPVRGVRLAFVSDPCREWRPARNGDRRKEDLVTSACVVGHRSPGRVPACCTAMGPEAHVTRSRLPRTQEGFVRCLLPSLRVLKALSLVRFHIVISSSLGKRRILAYRGRNGDVLFSHWLFVIVKVNGEQTRGSVLRKVWVSGVLGSDLGKERDSLRYGPYDIAGRNLKGISERRQGPGVALLLGDLPAP